MDVRDAGNTTLVKASQLENAYSPMDVRDAGNSTLIKAVQWENA